MGRCRNAYDVFPPELVEEIQEHFSGGLLWIPHDYERRNQDIYKLKQEGLSNMQIAERIGLSERSVRRIIQNASEQRTKN